MKLKDLNPVNWFQKDNRAQSVIARDAGYSVASSTIASAFQAYDRIETVNRGTNMIVSGASSFDFDIKDKKNSGVVQSVRAKTLENILNYKPNPYQSVQDFRRALYADFILEGNAFIYWDGQYMFHLPAANMIIQPDTTKHIKGFNYMNQVDFTPDEVFYFSDVGRKSIYRAESRLMSAMRSINILYKMQAFQDAFFENGAIPGLILETENTLSQAAKARTIETWRRDYNPKSGARKPMIVDNGLKIKEMFNVNFQDMDFDNSIARHDKKILTALGVPAVLIEGGNNANISPNLRLFYLETILPIVTAYTSSVERFFGFDVSPITTTVSALQPELKETSAYLTGLVNGGIITPNEARDELRYIKLTDQDMDEIRVPANIAGSAVDPTVGGAPKKPEPK